jgi:hypothetical protein
VAVVAVVAFPVNGPVKLADVTEVNPAKTVDDDPNDIDVDPIVTSLLARLALVMPAVPLKLPLVKPVIVLLPADIVFPVKVSVPSRVAKTPVNGNVTVVAPVVFRVKAFAPVVLKAPDVVKVPPVFMFPPNVMVFTPLSTPVPP